MGGPGRLPEREALARARALAGMGHVQLDGAAVSVRFDREGVMIDLGAIGKGYAIDCAMRLLREAGVTSALLHGGTSTTYAIGAPPREEAWQVAIASAPESSGGVGPLPQTIVRLRDEALSVSAGWGKSFVADGKTCGHVLDPRTGRPAARALLAAVALPSATESDALSTALLVAGRAGGRRMERLRPEMRTLLLTRDDRRGGCSSSGKLGK
jgi:thiamine biosynthesis lipoprotein